MKQKTARFKRVLVETELSINHFDAKTSSRCNRTRYRRRQV